MVVSRDHVLGAEVHQRDDRRAVDGLKEASVPRGDAVCVKKDGHEHGDRGRTARTAGAERIGRAIRPE